jgi:hypothetical protein
MLVWSGIKNFLISLSLANLIFLPVWNTITENTWYYDVSEISFSPILLPLTMLLVLALGTLIYGFFILENRSKNRFITASLTIFCTVAFAAIILWGLFDTVTMAEWRVYFSFINRGIKIALFTITLGCTAIYLAKNCYKDQLLKLYKNILFIFTPFLLLTFVQAAYTFTSIYFYRPEGPVPYLETKENQPRIALLLFDELDIRAAFDQRNPKLKLENLDLFKNESFYASKAYAGGPSTLISIPALLTGQHLSSIKIIAHDEALLTLPKEKRILNKNSPSLFSHARQMGYNCAVRGFYHPYHKLFGPHLTEGDFKPAYTYSFSEGMKYLLNKIFVSYISISPDLKKYLNVSRPAAPQILAAEHKNDGLNQEQAHQNLMNYWSDFLLNKKLNLLFLHFPYPHPPGIYDYEADRFCHSSQGSYLGNIKMVDKTLADMRQLMGEASLWDQTTIIVTADHWLRKYWSMFGYDYKEDELALVSSIDHRVPFMVKFANQKEPYIFDEAFNTVLVHDIILEMAKGTIQNPQQLAVWIQLNKDKVPLDVAESFP